jgi:hypothetical protein
MRDYLLVCVIGMLGLSCGTKGGNGQNPSTPNPNSENAPGKDPSETEGEADANPIVGKKIIFLDPGVASVGENLTVTVQIQDANGNLAAKMDGEVQINTGGGATRTGIVPITAGVGTVTITDDIAEIIRLDMSDPLPKDLDTSSTIEVNFIHDAATKIILGDVLETLAGVLLSVDVSAIDSFGNIDAGYSGSITLVASGSAQVAGIVAIKDGKGIGKIIDPKAETVTLSLDDQGQSGLNVKSTKTYNVVPNIPANFVMQPILNPKKNVPLDIEVQVQDSLFNLVPTYNGSVNVDASRNGVVGTGLVTIAGGKGTITITGTVAEEVVFTMRDPNNTGFERNSRTVNFAP